MIINFRINRQILPYILSTLLLLLALLPGRLGASALTLAWDPNTEDDLAGYNVYYGVQSRNYDSVIDVGNVTQYTVSNLEPETQYYFAVTAYDTSGNESDFSDEVGSITGEDPPEVVRVISPNGGEILTSGDSYSITWTTSETKESVAKVILRYTKNGGRRWKKIDTLTEDTGTYDWTVPDVPKTKSKCKVKVVLKDAKGNTGATDTSDGYFTIEPAP